MNTSRDSNELVHGDDGQNIAEKSFVQNVKPLPQGRKSPNKGYEGKVKTAQVEGSGMSWMLALLNSDFTLLCPAIVSETDLQGNFLLKTRLFMSLSVT
jgi:hypothetical protein